MTFAPQADGLPGGGTESISVPRDIICFGTDWYSPSKVSIRQLVDEFRRRGSRVLWINPVPIRFPDTRKKDFWKKVGTKARTHSRFLTRVDDGIQVYSPLYLPLYKGPGFALNRLVVSAQVLLLRLLLGIRKPLVMGSTFTAWFGLPAVRGLPFVFHFADKISAFREVADDPQRRGILERMEADIVAAATLATCSSRLIHEHVSALAGDDHAKAVHLPHAVDGELFFGEESPGAGGVPADMADLPRPRAGYFGSLTRTNDKETFLQAARSLPDWSFVFIGRVADDYDDLDALPNVHFLGPRDHARIPAYGRGFDVCFMGWRPHEWISNSFPLKTLEYLALAKPIVCSSRIVELDERFPGLVGTSASPEEFVRLLTEEHARDDDERRRVRLAAVREETWSRRVDRILAEMADREGAHGR